MTSDFPFCVSLALPGSDVSASTSRVPFFVPLDAHFLRNEPKKWKMTLLVRPRLLNCHA